MKRIFFFLCFSVLVILVPHPASAFTAECTGGTVTHVGGNTIHTFLASGTLDCTGTGGGTVSALVVGGGGGGGKSNDGNDGAAAGGGAGGYMYVLSHIVSAQSYDVIVGEGGSGAVGSGNIAGSDGGNSVFDTLTVIGGGGGGVPGGVAGHNGGSGGGSATTNASVGQGTLGQGNNGGEANTVPFLGGGGGGGSGGAGGNGDGHNGGAGGSGTDNSISGSPVTYAGGGGGGGTATGGAWAGGNATGGGGAGGSGLDAGGNAIMNTGGGGGGGGGSSTSLNGNGGNGGSGIVIVSYPTPSATAPVFTDVADQTFEATGPVTTPILTPPTVTDDVDTGLVATPDTTSFPVGITTVVWSATNTAGKTATTSSRVTIADTTSPSFVDVPADMSVSFPSHTGGAVTYTAPTASDIVDGPVVVSCTPSSGSNFSIGTTTVTCSAHDTAGNIATSVFSVGVTDTTPSDSGGGGTGGFISFPLPPIVPPRGEVLGAQTYNAGNGSRFAGTLSESQIQALLMFLRAFGVNAATLAQAEAALRS